MNTTDLRIRPGGRRIEQEPSPALRAEQAAITYAAALNRYLTAHQQLPIAQALTRAELQLRAPECQALAAVSCEGVSITILGDEVLLPGGHWQRLQEYGWSPSPGIDAYAFADDLVGIYVE